MARNQLLVILALPVAIVLAAGSLFAQDAADSADDHAVEVHAPDHFPINNPERQGWSFAGPLGSYDPAQLQRGFKVYEEVCKACHSISRVAFRNLMEDGGPMFTEGQARTVAAGYNIFEGYDANGLAIYRPALLSDLFPSQNQTGAVLAAGVAVPPDLSLMAKARAATRGFPMFIFDALLQYQEQGVDYIYALLTGYEAAPAGMDITSGYYNPYFLGGATLAMAPPLREDGQIEYDDETTPETVEQYARDVAAFLMWAAEPHLNERKATGFRVIIFLSVLALMLFFVKRRIWAKAH